MLSYGIVIEEGGDGWLVRLETTRYLGKLYTYVEFMPPDDKDEEKNYFPTVRAIVPPWVWRRVKKMISSGVDVRQIVRFISYAVKEFALISMADRHKPVYRIYYEEPHMLLSFLFSSQPTPIPEKQNLFNNPPRVFRCACNKS
jgi:hypothetical protein